MEKHNENNFLDLLTLKTQVDASLSDETLLKERTAFYEALRTLIDIKINEEEIYFKFDKLEQVLMAVALGNFDKRLDIPNQKNLFSFLATSINTVIEELQANVSKNEFLISSLQCISDAAIVTNSKGTILFVNDKATLLLNGEIESIIKLRIHNIFETHTQFGVSSGINVFEDIEIKIRPLKSQLAPVLLTVKEIKGKNEEVEGYIYIVKEII